MQRDEQSEELVVGSYMLKGETRPRGLMVSHTMGEHAEVWLIPWETLPKYTQEALLHIARFAGVRPAKKSPDPAQLALKL